MRINLPDKVTICECFARDGLQNRKDFLPTEKKIRIIDLFTELGYKMIEVTSFSHPKYLPQFSDSEDVLRGIKRREGVIYLGLIPNEKGLERALSFIDKGWGVDGIIVALAASEAYNMKNFRMGLKESLKGVEGMVERAKARGLYVIGCVGTAFGCEIEGNIPIERVIKIARRYKEIGVDEIMFGDTTGVANPLQVIQFFTTMKEEIEGAIFDAHFHNTRGCAMANCLAALQCGVTRFDSSLGGIGGRAAGIMPDAGTIYTGNIASEDLILMLEEMGIDTGIEQDRLIETVEIAEGLLGERLFGHTKDAGRVKH